MAAVIESARIPIVVFVIAALMVGVASPATADHEVDEAKALLIAYAESLDPTDPIDVQVRKAQDLVIALSELIPLLSSACLEFIGGAMEFPAIEPNTFGGYTVRFPGLGLTPGNQVTQGNYFARADGNSQMDCSLT